MPIVPIESIDDPLLSAYRQMKDKELARDGRRFIAEGENVVRRLLRSGLRVESVLIARRKQAAIAPLAAHHVPVFTADDEVIEQVIGFEFHSGVLACGIRPGPAPLRQLLPRADEPSLLAVCQEITNTENMGSIIRVSAALGVDALLLGERCCDPYFRQSVRVSMGTVFTLPMRRSDDLLLDLHELGEQGYCRIAAVLDPGAEPLSAAQRQRRIAIVFGSEAQGLDAATAARCDRRVTIPMHRGTDSLNVAIAAAIFLYELSPSRLRPGR